MSLDVKVDEEGLALFNLWEIVPASLSNTVCATMPVPDGKSPLGEPVIFMPPASDRKSTRLNSSH